MRSLTKRLAALLLMLTVSAMMLTPTQAYSELLNGGAGKSEDSVSRDVSNEEKRSTESDMTRDETDSEEEQWDDEETEEAEELEDFELSDIRTQGQDGNTAMMGLEAYPLATDSVISKSLLMANALLATELGKDASAYMHATITTNNDTYESGTTAMVSVKYTLERGQIHAGDYVIITIPEEIASKVSFSVNGQHFSGTEELGNGQYKLTFANNVESGFSGSFSAFVTTNAEKTTTGTITVGDASKTITVVPSGSPSGSGTYTDTIMKDAVDNSGIDYGGYDYSEGVGDKASQIGIADLTNGGTYKYRLYINNKKGKISNVTVIDKLPDGMTFHRSIDIEVTDRESGAVIDSSEYSIHYSGQTLIFKYPGEFSNTIQVNYWVDIPARSNASKFTNTATITYTQDGDVHQEHRSYVLQGLNNNASNGEKSVDKSIITNDPDDQLVTYTIKFWNSNGFAAGEINLEDQLVRMSSLSVLIRMSIFL